MVQGDPGAGEAASESQAHLPAGTEVSGWRGWTLGWGQGMTPANLAAVCRGLRWGSLPWAFWGQSVTGVATVGHVVKCRQGCLDSLWNNGDLPLKKQELKGKFIRKSGIRG
jgi:hypothetical protein